MSDHQGTGRGLLMCDSLFEEFLELGWPSIFCLGVYDENRTYRDKTHFIECKSYTSTKGGQVYDVRSFYVDILANPGGNLRILFEGGPDFETDILNQFRKLDPDVPASDLVCDLFNNEKAKEPCDTVKFMKDINPNSLTPLKEFVDEMFIE